MSIAFEKVYLGRGDVFKRRLSSDSIALDITGLTRVTLDFGGLVIDSDTSPTAFDWTTEGAAGILIFSLGLCNIPVGEYMAILTVYEPDYTDGLSDWGYIPVKILNPVGDSV